MKRKKYAASNEGRFIRQLKGKKEEKNETKEEKGRREQRDNSEECMWSRRRENACDQQR